ncbi:MAG: type II secretion system protein M [Comamonadaceae bacterium]|jgi:general secretion pathway protein M|nr:type II secretion system protein M [Comamonadaceae bacterium]
MNAPTMNTSLQARWKALRPREQNLISAASAVVALALLWWVALAPALNTLRTAPARHAALDAQLQRMHNLQAEALQLQAAPRSAPGDAVASLRSSLTQRLGATAELSLVGNRATITLKGAPADALAQWLTQARSNALAVPVEARLTRSAAAAPPTPTATLGNVPAAAAPRWDGSLVLTLPAH